MAKIAVVYKSKYGSTEKYAHWIAEDVKADIFKADNVKLDILLDYDTIVYCGGLYAGGILGFSLIKKNYAPVSYTHLRAHETVLDLVCRLLLEKKKQKIMNHRYRSPLRQDNIINRSCKLLYDVSI